MRQVRFAVYSFADFFRLQVTTVKLSSVQDHIAKSDKAFVVSCPEDRKEWEQLAAKTRVKIYSVEAVFESVVLQRLSFTKKHRIDQQTER